MTIVSRHPAGAHAFAPLTGLLALLVAAAVATPHAVLAQRITDQGSEAIEQAREAKKERERQRQAAPVPRGIVEVAETGAREWSGTYAGAVGALPAAAGDRGLRIVGPISIPDGEFARLRAKRGAVQRVWLCAPGEAENGPCLISLTVHEVHDRPGRARGSYRVWALKDATAAEVEVAIERADAVLAEIGG